MCFIYAAAVFSAATNKYRTKKKHDLLNHIRPETVDHASRVTDQKNEAARDCRDGRKSEN